MDRHSQLGELVWLVEVGLSVLAHLVTSGLPDVPLVGDTVQLTVDGALVRTHRFGKMVEGFGAHAPTDGRPRRP